MAFLRSINRRVNLRDEPQPRERPQEFSLMDIFRVLLFLETHCENKKVLLDLNKPTEDNPQKCSYPQIAFSLFVIFFFLVRTAEHL